MSDPTDPDPPTSPLDPAHLLGLDLDPERLYEVAAAFEDIRKSIEALREYQIDDAHPAVVFRPIGGEP
ncbi:MAG: hypothetical protein AAGB11_05765 [Pseudomonadota bacterium]